MKAVAVKFFASLRGLVSRAARQPKGRRAVLVAGFGVLAGVPLVTTWVWGDDPLQVEVEVPAARVLAPTILASGMLTYESQVTLVPEVVARVEKIFVNEGDTIEKGQLLLRLDAEASHAEIAQLTAERRQSELNIERQRVSRDAMVTKARRYKELRALGLVEATRYDELVMQRDLAEVELRNSREAVKQADALFKQSEQRLAKTEIRSPIAGRVTSILIKEGETAIPGATGIAGSALMVVSDTRSLFAEVGVDESDIARVVAGQGAKIVPAAFPDKPMFGKVEKIAVVPRQVPGQSRSYAVRIRLDPKDAGIFRPGMSCRAEVTAAARTDARRLSLPVQSVQLDEVEHGSDKPRSYVFAVRKGRAVRLEVETGLADDHHIEILSGVTEGDRVVVGPAKTLRNLDAETPVTAISAAPGPRQRDGKPS